MSRVFYQWIPSVLYFSLCCFLPECNSPNNPDGKFIWQAPDSTKIPKGKEGSLIRYGRELVVNTSHFFGPNGSISTSANGMNCQNCHLEAGTRIWGNNFSAVFANYPRYKERRGNTETIVQKINDCFERSLNGTAPDSNSLEIRAIYAYIKWLGKGVPKNVKPEGSSIKSLPYLNTAADTALGRDIFFQRCISCHGRDGQGKPRPDKPGSSYPPLWGPKSFNTGASMHRLTKISGFVKYNMPYVANPIGPQLSDEEAWAVSAYIISHSRPIQDRSADWPDLKTKGIDIDQGPYADTFSEIQHKYGPFQPILNKK